MASELRVNTLKDASGNNSVALSVVTGGVAKAFNAYDFNTDTQRDSFNVSSTTDRGTGSSYANLSSAMGTATYITVSSSSPVAIGSMGTNNFNRAAISSPDTASRISHNSFTTNGSGSIQNDPYTAVVAHGDLA